MRDFQRSRSLFGLLAIVALLLLPSFLSMAQTELIVELGFEGRLTPSHYAPIRIEVINYQETGPSRLRITQLAGNEWRGEATLQQELGYVVQSSGQYHAVIPIYDPVNPIVVELLSSQDVVLAQRTVDCRDAMQATPYPVLDKQLPRFDDRAAIIAPASLPTQWWGLDSAESLWVASPLPSETWSAISQWVLAGGSLVVLTGANFYRMDSPALRNLIPVGNPDVMTTERGTSYLTGQYDAATIDLLSDEGFALLSHRRYGAGQVSLISVHAQSLSVEDLRLIAAHIVPSQLVSLEGLSEIFLGGETVVTLDSLFVLGMIALLAILVCVCALVGRRAPRAGWAVLMAGACLVAVLSGFVSNPASHTVGYYTVNTYLYVQDTVGFLSVSSCYFSQTTSPFSQTLKSDIFPLQLLPRTLRGVTSFSSLTTSHQMQQRLAFGDMRRWHAYTNSSAVFDFELLSGTSVRINNYHASGFESGWILINGTVHPIAEVHRGNHEYVLNPAAALTMGTFLSTGYTRNATSVFRLVSEMKDFLGLSKGIWLVAATDERRIEGDDIAKKVRDITLVIARGEEDVHAN
ncbi:hypothetical protein KKG90_00995 [Candidatus Bipolaricaulota bacterium]|nr:hypothetical protein [Candidatus Bipolaricaulota bacterium]